MWSSLACRPTSKRGSQRQPALRERRRRAVQELDVLEEDAAVYKLVGPMLIKQDLVEAKSNVSKRLEYIGGEMCVCACLCLCLRV